MTVLGILVTRNVQDTAKDHSLGALRNQNRLIADLLASISKLLKLEAAAKSGNLVGAEAGISAIEGECRAAQAALASIDDLEACYA